MRLVFQHINASYPFLGTFGGVIKVSVESEWVESDLNKQLNRVTGSARIVIGNSQAKASRYLYYPPVRRENVGERIPMENPTEVTERFEGETVFMSHDGIGTVKMKMNRRDRISVTLTMCDLVVDEPVINHQVQVEKIDQTDDEKWRIVGEVVE